MLTLGAVYEVKWSALKTNTPLCDCYIDLLHRLHNSSLGLSVCFIFRIYWIWISVFVSPGNCIAFASLENRYWKFYLVIIHTGRLQNKHTVRMVMFLFITKHIFIFLNITLSCCPIWKTSIRCLTLTFSGRCRNLTVAICRSSPFHFFHVAVSKPCRLFEILLLQPGSLVNYPNIMV